MKQTTTSPKQTPLKKLSAEKKRLRTLHRLQKEKLETEFLYMRDNMGSLIFSGVSALLSTNGSSRPKKKDAVTTSSILPKKTSSSLGIADFLPIGSGLLPVVWEIAQPFILTWSVRRVKKWLGGFFISKKK